ncbi:MAG TPA: BadF/BadG/BcrA/BcrD ATPase family protein [Methylomirabilota bacterium]|nr:BadF/BadG/BcrA/BcrD ATPase family protein [Methylomirabilota bacterium]
MAALGQRQCRLAVGVDLGGTWIRIAAVMDDRRRASVIHRAPALPELATFLRTLWRRRGWTGRVDALVVAARGVWLPRERRAHMRALRGLARRVRVIADVEAAWHATLGDGAGILVLAGTGSIVLGRTARGRWARAGGLGPLLGDEGSGFWIGRMWLRARAAPSAQRRLATRADAVAAIAALAPRVLARARRGDPLAARVVREAQTALAAQAHEVVRALALRGVIVVGGAGSIMRNRWFAAGVRRALGRTGLRVRWRTATHTAVDAAARLALTLGARREGRRRG